MGTEVTVYARECRPKESLGQVYKVSDRIAKQESPSIKAKLSL